MSDREIFLREYTLALAEDGASVLVGAGTSMAAGYPSWKGLLREIASDLGLEIEDVDDPTAVAQWAIGADHSNRTTVLNAIREQIEPDHAIPSALLSLARLVDDAMTRTDQAGWFPWVLPLKILTAPDPVHYALLGGIGGLVLLAVMIADLARHDFR